MDNKYLTVTALNNYLKAKLDQDNHLKKIYLKGEISNLKIHSSGHYYFTIKDENARISAVMFSSYAKNVNVEIKEGMQALFTGSVAMYVSAGTFQLYVYNIEEDGVGKLYLELEKIKQKLLAEGLFDKKNKKQLPKFPKKIGVVTAYPSAAAKDILRTISDRYPITKVLLFPSLVQGNNAFFDIINMINKAEEYEVDVLIIARGGGSFEDLWNFNNEMLLRRVYECNIPVISGVGHEVDTTLIDYVADYRAPTPTAAAVAAVPDCRELLIQLDNNNERIINNINAKLSNIKTRLQYINNTAVIKNPDTLISNKRQLLINNTINIQVHINNKINNYNNQLGRYNTTLINDYKNYIQYNRIKLSLNVNKLEDSIKRNIEYKHNKFIKHVSDLNILNPLSILERGYSLVKFNNNLINDTSTIKVDDVIDVKLHKGEIKAKITEVNNG